ASCLDVLRLSRRHLRFRDGDLRSGVLQSRSRRVDLGLQVAPVDLDEELALGDFLIVSDQHLHHVAGDLRKDRIDVALDLGVIRFGVVAVENDLLDSECDPSQHREQENEQADAASGSLLRGGGRRRRRDFLLGAVDRLQRRRAGLSFFAAHGVSFSPMRSRMRPVARARSYRACDSSASAAIRSALAVAYEVWALSTSIEEDTPLENRSRANSSSSEARRTFSSATCPRLAALSRLKSA